MLLMLCSTKVLLIVLLTTLYYCFVFFYWWCLLHLVMISIDFSTSILLIYLLVFSFHCYIYLLWLNIRMIEVTLLEAVVVYLFVVVVYWLDVEFLVVVMIIFKSILIAIEPITLLIDVGRLHGKLYWPPRTAYLSGTTRLFTAHDYNTLGTSADESLTLSVSDYDSLLQKIHSVSTSDIAFGTSRYFLFSEFITFILDH